MYNEQSGIRKSCVVKRNYDYLLLAKQSGFFQNGWDSEDIASCDDWVITWWIDELGEKNKMKKNTKMKYYRLLKDGFQMV